MIPEENRDIEGLIGLAENFNNDPKRYYWPITITNNKLELVIQLMMRHQSVESYGYGELDKYLQFLSLQTYEVSNTYPRGVSTMMVHKIEHNMLLIAYNNYYLVNKVFIDNLVIPEDVGAYKRDISLWAYKVDQLNDTLSSFGYERVTNRKDLRRVLHDLDDPLIETMLFVNFFVSKLYDGDTFETFRSLFAWS